MTPRTACCHEDAAARQRLMSAALELFNTKGYAATSVREIVQAAGVTKPVLYYYFGSKEGLFNAILTEAAGVFRSIIEQTQSRGGTVRERIGALCLAVDAAFTENIEIPKLMHQIVYGPREGTPAFDTSVFSRMFVDVLARLVAEGIASGEIADRDPRLISLSLAGVTHVAMEQQLIEKGFKVSPDEMIRMLDMLFDGIRTR